MANLGHTNAIAWQIALTISSLVASCKAVTRLPLYSRILGTDSNLTIQNDIN